MQKNIFFTRNAKKPAVILNRRTKKVMKEKIKSTPCDHIETEIIPNYPIANHKILGIPGRHINSEDTDLFLIDGGSVKPDVVTRIRLDNFKVVDELAAVIENLSTPIDKKIPDLLKYDLSVISRLKIGCINYIVTHIDPGWREKTFFIDGIPLHMKIVLFDEKTIAKILNTLTKKKIIIQKL